MAFIGKINAFESESKRGNGLFLSFFNYTVGKDQRFSAIIKTILRNATYTSLDMQNKLLAAISSVVTEGIEQDIGNSWYTIKVDNTTDPADVENVSIIIRWFNEHFFKIAKPLWVLSITDLGDAKLITDVILAELTNAGLTLSKILSQVYDGASVMEIQCGGVQRLLQE